jgi:DNA ligase 1
MKMFVDLFTALDETNKTNEKVEAMRKYFEKAAPEDAAWCIYFLSGRKPRQLVPNAKLAFWSIEESGMPDWMFDESYEAVGDFAETMALLLPAPGADINIPLHEAVEILFSLRKLPEDEQRDIVIETWRSLDVKARYVWNKLITGAFRVGVSQQLVVRALAQISGIKAEVIAHRLMGAWEPNAKFYQALINPDTEDADVSRPYPFFLAYPLENDPSALGDVREWAAEWKWDGIRCQLIHRHGQNFLWSRGEELISERFPEVTTIGDSLPEGTVIDGEILPWKNGAVLDFAQLQLRIGRKTVGKKLLVDVPVILMAYDLLELNGEDVREKPYIWRRRELERLVNNCNLEAFKLSPCVNATTWEQLIESRNISRSNSVEGLILKGRSSPYRVGRQRGDWWKWKVDPYTIDAVLIYAQRGSGRRASLYTDYTFGVWDREGKLVPIAKAYSGLTDAEIAQVDAFVRKNTLEKFGPVRTVRPELVFELAFEGIQKSTRHKSGIAVRFPRIARWRLDKPPQEADSLETIESMLLN